MILGITGTIGSGKGTVVEYLRVKKDFLHYSISGDILTGILEQRGEFVDRDSLNQVANELRAKDSAGPIRVAYERYLEEGKDRDVIIEALHSVPEVKFIQSIGGVVLGVTADPDIRYDRISARGSVKDNVTREEFQEQQKREEDGTGDQNTSNLSATLQAANLVITNNGSLAELQAQIDMVLEQIQHENHS